MIDLLIFFIGICLGSIIGYMKGTQNLIEMLIKYPEELEKLKRQISNLPKPKEIPKEQELMTIERHGDQLYAFTNSGDFLAQAPSMTLLMDRIKERFPGRVFKGELSAKDAKDFGIIQ